MLFPGKVFCVTAQEGHSEIIDTALAFCTLDETKNSVYLQNADGKSRTVEFFPPFGEDWNGLRKDSTSTVNILKSLNLNLMNKSFALFRES